MSSRQQYFIDLLRDCDDAADEYAGGVAIDTNARMLLITALILSDSLNGVRRALLDVADATRQGGRG